MYFVTVSQIKEHFKLEVLTPDIDYKNRKITECDVNRPALQLAGFFDYFDPTRLQIIGKVEHTYLEKVSQEERAQKIRRLMSYKEIPCIVICREEIEAFPEMLECAKENGIPIFKTDLPTTSFLAEANRWLHVELAPRISMHGVLVDIYGEGILITGESGIGKSETALELVRRGHRLVADDAVEIKRVSASTLLGSAPEVIRHFIEVRGIGIVDIKQIFGVGSVKEMKNIDLVIKLELWDQNKQYDRLGLTNEYTDILGIKVVTNAIPVRPGRNIAIICETAAINFRQKKMGYNAAEALNNRVMSNLQKNNFN
ncbi:HPr(Ser) kinase/phosphatase [Sporanaerobium hydrogeniformans]|uniref:HPr(Ser) kinase/phosphatase n=1 Tax=Sporanaerobium hydrogeniformans TaxID=3072179 RepID=A0AC61DJA2_9FIRM|nr:HPr(Ser) kinase/phosphatase [Sporanaerobium hydrogeniformans]PHV72047.1 HPr(Ser) kinase/phosphatase [Sporanaerobium hydrogeniformans]